MFKLSLSLSQLSVSLSFFSSKNILKVKNVWTKIEQQPVSPFKTLTDVVCCCSHRWNSSSMASEQETTPRTGEQKCVDSAPHRPNVISTDKTTTTKKRKEDENRRRRLKLLRQSNWSYLLYRVHFNLDTNQKIWSEKNLAQLFWGYLIFCCVRCTFEISPPPRKSIWILKKKVDWETRHDDDKHQKLWSTFWSRVLPENKKKKDFFKKHHGDEFE